MENPIEESGAASMKAMDTWLTDQLKARAQIQKQSRLYREEMSHHQRDKGYGNEDGSSWKKKGKGKAKAKSGASSSGAGAGDS